MTQWATTAVTLDHSFLLPSYRLFVNQLNGCIWLRLYVGFWSAKSCQFVGNKQKAYLLPKMSTVSSLKHLRPGRTDLIFHDRLFEARTRHGPLPRELAGGPGCGTVWCLKEGATLARLRQFLERRIPCTYRVDGYCIGRRDIRLELPRRGITGWTRVLAETRSSDRIVGRPNEARRPRRESGDATPRGGEHRARYREEWEPGR